MTFVVSAVNTDVVNPCATTTVVVKVDVHPRLVALLRYLLDTPDEDGVERSQQSIADATHGTVSQSAISTYLAGTRRAKIDTAWAVGRAFGVRDAYFTDPDPVELVDYMGTYVEREREGYAALDALFLERKDSGRPVPKAVADKARRLFAAGGAATRIEALALLDAAETIVRREAPEHPDAKSTGDLVKRRPKPSRAT